MIDPEWTPFLGAMFLLISFVAFMAVVFYIGSRFGL